MCIRNNTLFYKKTNIEDNLWAIYKWHFHPICDRKGVSANTEGQYGITLTLNELKKRPAGCFVCGGEHTHTERIFWSQALCYGRMPNALLELVTYKDVT